MEFAVIQYLVGTSKAVFTALRVELTAKELIAFMSPQAKLSFALGLSLYHISDMTHYSLYMKPYLPKMDFFKRIYSQEVLGMAAQIKLLRTARKYVTDHKFKLKSKNTGITESNDLDDVTASRSISESKVVILLKDQHQVALESETQFSSSFEELRALRSEMAQDIKSSAVSGIEKAGQKYLDLTFRDKRVHRACIDVLNRAIREKSFISESREFGIYLINEVVKDKTFLNEVKQASLRVIKNDDIKQCSIDVLKHVVEHATTRSYTIALMTDVLTNTEAKDALVDALAESTMKAVQSPETISNIGKLFNKTAANSEVQNEARSALVTKNLYDLITPSFLKSSENTKAYM